MPVLLDEPVKARLPDTLMAEVNEQPEPCTWSRCAPGAVPFGTSIEPANLPDASETIVPIG